MRRLTLGPYPVIGLAEARGLAAAALREVHHGNDPAAAKQEARAADTFADLARLYIERYAKPTKRTWARDEWLCNRELLPSWRNRKAAEISRKDVIALLDRIVERGVPVLANRTKGLVSKMFNFALRRGIVEVNPAYGIGNPSGQERQRSRVIRRRNPPHMDRARRRVIQGRRDFQAHAAHGAAQGRGLRHALG